jgi:arylsulfatase A-like enzyme
MGTSLHERQQEDWMTATDYSIFNDVCRQEVIHSPAPGKLPERPEAKKAPPDSEAPGKGSAPPRERRGRPVPSATLPLLSVLVLLAALAGLARAGRAAEGAAKSDRARPNVLFVAVDDLNDWVGFLGGHPQGATANLDRLAERGVLFTRAYCSAPACNPSRASLMCSIRPSTSGVYHNSQPWRPVLPDAVTLPQHFMAHGYRVGGCGKIYHGRFPDPPSWHEYLRRPADPVPPERPLNGLPRTAHFDWGPIDAPDSRMGDFQVVSWAIDYLRRDHQKPFFLAVGLFRPHLPWYVPRSYFQPYPEEKIQLPVVKDDDLDDVPPLGKRMAKPAGDHKRVVESNNWKKAVAGYLASIAFADTMIGRLLEALDESPYARNTIIVLWGDHGWHLGEKKHWRKFALWEEATRVPLVIVAPGVTKPGTRCGRTVSLLDLYPTLVKLAGLEPRAELEGRSLLPLLRDPAAPWDRPVVTTHGRNNHAVRSERWRYIRYRDGTEELYDHDRDPMEWTNLAEKPEHREVKEKLARWLPEVNAEDAPQGAQKARGKQRARTTKEQRKQRQAKKEKQKEI